MLHVDYCGPEYFFITLETHNQVKSKVFKMFKKRVFGVAWWFVKMICKMVIRWWDTSWFPFVNLLLFYQRGCFSKHDGDAKKVFQNIALIMTTFKSKVRNRSMWFIFTNWEFCHFTLWVLERMGKKWTKIHNAHAEMYCSVKLHKVMLSFVYCPCHD